MAGPVQIEMERKLRQAFEPTHLEVVNESYKHCVPKDSETHFKVKLMLCQCTNQPTHVWPRVTTGGHRQREIRRRPATGAPPVPNPPFASLSLLRLALFDARVFACPLRQVGERDAGGGTQRRGTSTACRFRVVRRHGSALGLGNHLRAGPRALDNGQDASAVGPGW